LTILQSAKFSSLILTDLTERETFPLPWSLTMCRLRQMFLGQSPVNGCNSDPISVQRLVMRLSRTVSRLVFMENEIYYTTRKTQWAGLLLQRLAKECLT
jgi:hypothetical protein